MELVIGAILIILIIFVSGYIIKKKFYKEIDRLESWKIEIMNRPVIDELGKVKQLNMTGETEEMFERWRKNWDDIVAVELPDIEDHLFDSEEFTDKYRFKLAKESNQKIEAILTNIDAKIDKILGELNELIGSEESNRAEMEELSAEHKKIKKTLLIQRHTYGTSIDALEKKLDSLSEQFVVYNDLTANGDYLKAREVVIMLKDEIQTLTEKIEKIPDLITEVNIIPSQLNEIEEGYKEMIDQGFILDHLNMDKELEELRKSLEINTDLLVKTEVKEVESGIYEQKEKIDLLYELLEKEVHEKHFIIKNREETKNQLERIKESNEQIKEEVNFVQQSYQLLDGELNTPYSLEKQLTKLTKRFEVLETKITEDHSAFTILGADLREIREGIEKLNQDQHDFSLHLQNLRKDELEARDKLTELRRKTNEATRLITKSNIPGLPDDYKQLMDDVNKYIQDVFKSLNEKPLNIKAIQDFLQNAIEAVDVFYNKSVEMIETVVLVEKVIQYGNRYRARNRNLAEGLQRAEEYFRSYDYYSALEEAASAIEGVEPGALKQIEEMITKEEI
ncbi:septation ring formation regulator EzrA [Heyndrickxia oleronia]|uniref:septation ring formation regulator EzrA n=1 Tax=Heyndrickxia oleronia TaxID=38875 RepID=UPI00203FB9A1|nr:septation ring formation regulator EzrA [Heyndrickxia oleronia]MCM3455974.1 septation ring formation regulator EzrA [Heyndrickxia oleronia]